MEPFPTKKWFACQSLNKILTVVSISIFIKPEIHNLLTYSECVGHMCRRTQVADVLGLYVDVYAQRIAPAPIGVKGSPFHNLLA